MSKPDASISVGADGSAFSKTIKAIEQNTDTMANSITAKLFDFCCQYSYSFSLLIAVAYCTTITSTMS
jgi:hypothetical protein